MKILQFTLPQPENKTIITKEESLSHFYPHLHRHNEVQLTWVIKGEGILVTDNTMHSFSSNEIYWIGANQPHVFKSDHSYFQRKNQRKVHSIDIFFNPETQLSSFFSIPEVMHLKNFTRQHTNGFRVPQASVNEIAEKMDRVNKSSGIEQFTFFIDLLKKLSAFEDLEPLSNQSHNISCSDHEGIRLATIYNYVMQHYHEQISLEDIARVAYMTPPAFCRYFKKHTHQTLVSFINQVRINQACKDLVENNYESIAAIGYNTGFNSITNFNRVFKSVTKKSPKEYIESYFNNINPSIPSSTKN